MTDSPDDALWLFNSTETRKLYSYLAYAEKAVQAGEAVKLSDLRAIVAFDRMLQATMTHEVTAILHRFEHEHPAVASQLCVPNEFRKGTPASAIVPDANTSDEGARMYVLIKLAA